MARLSEQETTAPPEVRFDRIVKNERWGAEVTDANVLNAGIHLGRYTPDASRLGIFLEQFRERLNRSLSQAGTIDGRPFFVDYIDSESINAKAFTDADTSFIGLNKGLIERCLRIAQTIVKNTEIQQRFYLDSLESRTAWMAAIFELQVKFVVAHEYGHHILGHLSEPESGTHYWSEWSSDERPSGNLQSQADECCADSIATNLVVHNLFRSETGQSILKKTKRVGLPTNLQEQLLSLDFIAATAAFMLLTKIDQVDNESCYKRQHPLPIVRMQFVAQFFVELLKNMRPDLVDVMNHDKFMDILTLLAHIIYGVRGELIWSQHYAFITSLPGIEYHEKLAALWASSRRIFRERTEGKLIPPQYIYSETRY